jgi:CelD/BcsL family acetyltransferase involved in cellulose biosynthesis
MSPAELQEKPMALPVHEPRWVREVMRLPYVFAGRALFAIRRFGLIFDGPFNQVIVGLSGLPQLPVEFPEQVQAARIFACPRTFSARRIELLKRAILYVPAQYEHFYVSVSGTFEQYLQKFSSKTRWTFRKKVKRFMESGGAHPFREYRDAGSMREFYALSRAVSEKTYQQKLLDAGIPVEKDFPDQLQHRAAGAGVRGYVLLHDQVPAAYALWYVYGETVTLDKMGYDPKYADLNPGTVLTYLSLQRLFAEQRFKTLDFGAGYYDYKELFATDSIRCADVIYLRRTAVNLLAVCSHAALEIVSDLLKRMLAAVGLKAKVKKLIHRHA